MSATRSAAKHASDRYRRAFHGALRPVRGAESEVHHLREIEHKGEAGESIYIATLGVILFLIPIVVCVMLLAFIAFYLAS